MRYLKEHWQSVQKIRLQKFALFQLFPFMAVAFWRMGKDGTALLWRASILLFCFSPHCTWKVPPPVTAASLCLIFIAISSCLIQSMDPRWLNSQEPCFAGWPQPKTHKKTQFSVCWKRWLLVLSRNQHRMCLSSFVLFPLSLPFPRTAVNLIIPYIIVMQTKTEHTFSCTHSFTSSKKKMLRSIY